MRASWIDTRSNNNERVKSTHAHHAHASPCPRENSSENSSVHGLKHKSDHHSSVKGMAKGLDGRGM